MPTCSRCGKKGIFLRIDPVLRMCEKCVEQKRIEDQIEKDRKEQKRIQDLIEKEREEKERIEKIQEEKREQIRIEKEIKKQEFLIATAKEKEEKALKADTFAAFMKLYNDAIYCMREAVEIRFGAKSDYERLLNDKQWHIRDAIEKECNEIIKDAKGKFRNNKGVIIERSKKFRTSILICKQNNEFNEETLLFAEKMLHILSVKIGLDSLELNTKKRRVRFYEIDSLEGHAFEYWCADLLKNNGFENVEVTQGSNDQGVDIVAQKGDIRYAIQCKCYSSDLGNTPIQEVVAGKTYYKCHVGVVMTNRYFTGSAKALAKATGTLLWDRDKLESMYSYSYDKMQEKWFRSNGMMSGYRNESGMTNDMIHAILDYSEKSDEEDSDLKMMWQMKWFIYSTNAEIKRLLAEYDSKYSSELLNQAAQGMQTVAADPMEAAALQRRRLGAVEAQNAQPIKRKKLYNEKIEAVQKKEAVQDSTSKEALFNAGDENNSHIISLL
ncbi:MAG: restriction endonuclease [Clostridia bacterium]|nr:restriction endonuclease [Clostridia bacterium]